MRQNGQMKSDQIAISGPSPVESIAGTLAPAASVSAWPTSSSTATSCSPPRDAAPLLGGAVLIRDGAVAEVGDRDALRRAHPGAPRSSAATACSCCRA